MRCIMDGDMIPSDARNVYTYIECTFHMQIEHVSHANCAHFACGLHAFGTCANVFSQSLARALQAYTRHRKK